MFHIFYLNRGYMLRLEPPALGSIYDLQKCVANSAGIETQDQFLFLSGGASLSANTPLSSSTISGFGTDANPIFLVKRVANVQPEPVKENAEGINELYQGWVSGIERLDRISTNSSSAITECVEMGKKCATVTETIVKFCSNIISEHQYLHQGWMAVIANLDDNVQRIQKRLDRALGQAEKLGMIQEKGRNLLADFDNVIEMLSKIIIPPSLLSTHALGAKNLSDSIDTEEMTLYDWISSKDQAYSLDALSQHVLDHLDKTDDSDLREAQAFFGMVNDVAKKSQYRDIGGIDKRLAMLNSKLQHLEDCLAKVRESTSRIIQPVIQDSTQNVAIYQKQLLSGLKQPLKNLYDYAHCFINSKDEVVKNISQRFSTWIRQAYQRLHECTKKIVIFEEKFAGLRQRLDLARQIKEAPNIYMTAVPEVIRREELKKEFSEWVKTHIDKCSTFIREENKIREEFQLKLERHFLCQLFAGMGDRIPQFTAQNPPKIDQNLPRITAQHLTELRRAFPNMKNMLIVCTPRIFPRLAIPDPNATFPSSSMAMGQSSQIRREQSFYDRERISNIDAMNRNFPSTNWLSEENMELVSPSTIAGHNFLGMARGSTSLSASAIGQIDMHQSPPQELGPLGSDQPVQFSLANSNVERSNRGSMSPLQPSAPISIPIAGNNALHGDLIESIGSNHFSTPEEFGSFGSNSGPGRFIGASGNNLRNTFPSNAFRCSPKITRPLSLIRASQQPAVLHEESPKKNEASQTTASTISSPIEFESKLMNAQNELKELAKLISTLREFGMHMQNFTISLDVSQLMHQFGNLIDSNVATAIENYKKLAEKENANKIAEIETFHREQIDRLNGEIEQERRVQKSKDQQIAELQAQIGALNEQVYNLQAEKTKTILDEAAIVENEEKKCDEQPMNDPSIQDATQQMNNMAFSQSMVEIREEQPQNPSSAPGSDEDEGIARLSSRSCSTQTKVRSRDMAQFVSLNEIYEGFGALIIWNGQMNAFMAHCSNPRALPYIVKESCLEKLNIRKPPKPAAQSGESTSTAAAPTPQRTWAFVMVDTIEPCQIKKVSNRYNLPIETRFFRIAVKPMLGDFGSSLSSAASSIASSKR